MVMHSSIFFLFLPSLSFLPFPLPFPFFSSPLSLFLCNMGWHGMVWYGGWFYVCILYVVVCGGGGGGGGGGMFVLYVCIVCCMYFVCGVLPRNYL